MFPLGTTQGCSPELFVLSKQAETKGKKALSAWLSSIGHHGGCRKKQDRATAEAALSCAVLGSPI